MSALMRSAMVLTFARLANYVVMFVSPLLLVRLLDVTTYGKYREFLLYASILAGVFSLAIKDNLIYSVPRRPTDAPVAVSQTIGMLLLTSIVGSLVFVLGSGFFLQKASFDFLWPVLLYVFFFLNFDVVENYWLARQESRLVLLYGTARVLLRVLVVVGATYLTNDLGFILTSMVVLEVLKTVFCIILLLRLKLITFAVDRKLLGEQLRYVIPLSAAGLLLMVNEKAGHLFISTTLGAASLAIYTVGMYQLPITAIVRSAVSDSMFPEMVRHAGKGSQDGLKLWRAANLYYCFLVFPVFAILFFFAEEFIVTLFTAAYRDAVSVFQIALFVMIRQCFEMGTPLRAVNANRYMLWGNLLAIALHLPLLYVLAATMGIPGAALAWLTADLVLSMYLAWQITKMYKIGFGDLAHWPQVLKLALCALLAGPVLLLYSAGLSKSIWMAGICAALFSAVYVLMAKFAGIPEVDLLLLRLRGMIASVLRKHRS